MMVFQSSDRSMAPPSPRKASGGRPGTKRAASASRSNPDTEKDSKESPKLAKRSHTFQPGAQHKPQRHDAQETPDTFDGAEHTDNEESIEVSRASVELDSLPIELVTLTDSFIESLGAKVHSTPPSIDKLSQLFQDFYAQASTNINTHINALATRHGRDSAPATQSTSSLVSAASRLRNKTSSLSVNKEKAKPETEHQMLTPDELSNKRQARKALESQRANLEEAVERRLCEGIYDRIYRHKSTQDEAQDDKLRSKTAALSLVGIGPADLGVDISGGGDNNSLTPEAIKEKTDQIKTWLEQARKDLIHMHHSRYPLGKLNRLRAAHRSIVDTIAQFHPSASADEVMPMLIFTLITLPPENLHVISDSRFIQNFRWEPKLTGEAAYCLTNLEAAISFLETVDLSTLRSDELPSGPPKNAVGASKTETFPPAYSQGTAPASKSAPDTTKANATAPKAGVPPSGLKPTNVLRNRRLSDLVNTPAQALGAASDAVINTADQGLKTVSNSLGDSYKFLLGKLREHQDGPREPIAVPRTLDDARKLVSTPPPDEEAEDVDQRKRLSLREDTILNLIGGRRDRSADSSVSGRSSSRQRGIFQDEGKAATPSSTGASQNPAMLDQVRSLSNSFNPLSRLTTQFGSIRGFGRTTPVASPAVDASKVADGGDLATAFPDLAAALPPKPKIPPPNKRFMELQNPADLRISEVIELLRDYRRLAGALENMDAFERR
ncbi:unnamed protein product [Clonostachys chloroleuca]|uniref:VPS9 domain-containing protein n=1 Tax=Clonostachys chloroleuca TaxID=1926264 RepID=A0AA35M1S6_9HYPO|nr:unnamed protein product [Clonostachys chloroleuca]